MSIIITTNGKDAKRLEPMEIALEEYVQRYIHDNPESLPLDEIDEGLKLLVLAREYPTPSGPIDALGIDGAGSVYVIETKLYRNPDKRHVVAQALDYGAALWSAASSGTALIDWLEIAAEKNSTKSLRDWIADFYKLQPEEVTDLLQTMQRNALEGRFRFVVLMDRLHDRLKDLITFVNRNSQFTLYGVELEFYHFNEHEIVIPKLYGAESRPHNEPTGVRRTWNEASYLEELKKHVGPEEFEAIHTFYRFCRERGTISWGSGKSGSFNPKFPAYHPTMAPFSVYGDGAFYLKVGWLPDHPTATERGVRFADALRRIFGDAISSTKALPECFLQASVWTPRHVEIEQAITECFL